MNNLRYEIELLQQSLCVNTTNDDNCAAFIPDFWRAIAGEVYPVAWGHLCEDIAVRRHLIVKSSHLHIIV